MKRGTGLGIVVRLVYAQVYVCLGVNHDAPHLSMLAVFACHSLAIVPVEGGEDTAASSPGPNLIQTFCTSCARSRGNI